jgi:hypothetical protein
MTNEELEVLKTVTRINKVMSSMREDAEELKMYDDLEQNMLMIERIVRHISMNTSGQVKGSNFNREFKTADGSMTITLRQDRKL